MAYACWGRSRFAHSQRARSSGSDCSIPATAPTATADIELEAFRGGLRDLGWVEGRNIIIETRWAGASPQRQRELAAKLKAMPVTLIVALATTTIAAARDGAPGLPIVMINAGIPRGRGVREKPRPARRRPDRHFGRR